MKKIFFTQQVRKYGDSLSVVIPSKVCKKVKIQKDDIIDFFIRIEEKKVPKEDNNDVI